MTENFRDIEDTYINEILNKSIYDYLNDKYNNQKILYEKQLKTLKNTKIKDIRLQCFTDNNGNLLTFDIYNNNNEECKIDSNNYRYQRLEDFKWIFKNSISSHIAISRVNEIIKSHYSKNIQSPYLYGITNDDLLMPIDIDINLLLDQLENNQNKNNENLISKIEYQENKINELIKKTNNHTKINDEFILRIVDYEEKLKNQNDIIQYLISKKEDQTKLNKELLLKIENCNERINNNTIINDKQNNRTKNLFLYLLVSFYSFVFYSILSK
jgi:hypothetical protein